MENIVITFLLQLNEDSQPPATNKSFEKQF